MLRQAQGAFEPLHQRRDANGAIAPCSRTATTKRCSFSARTGVPLSPIKRQRGEARNDYLTFADLAHRLGYGERWP